MSIAEFPFFFFSFFFCNAALEYIQFSDFFDDVNSTLTALKHFRYKKNEVIVFHILDPIERSFAFGKDAVFKDMETTEEITTQPFQIQKAPFEGLFCCPIVRFDTTWFTITRCRAWFRC